MALPLLNAPEFFTNVPSTKQEIKFRPFLVKEEKILFMALQGNSPQEMNRAVESILTACVLTENFNVKDLALYDIEYLFLKLRGKSVGEVVELRVKHNNSECPHATDVSINLDDINVSFPDDYTDKIELTDEIGIQLRHPGVNQSKALTDNTEMDFESLLSLIADCVVCIYDSNNVFDTFTKKEVVEFLENLSQRQFEKIQSFFTNIPKLSHKIEWKCPKCEEHDSVTVEGLASFFT